MSSHSYSPVILQETAAVLLNLKGRFLHVNYFTNKIQFEIPERGERQVVRKCFYFTGTEDKGYHWNTLLVQVKVMYTDETQKIKTLCKSSFISVMQLKRRNQHMR
uniref:Uncharacterized protein n=1 Tax=Micrurus surinamensis TaxID=129470 RepID=A0A2D4NMX6_MICSU